MDEFLNVLCKTHHSQQVIPYMTSTACPSEKGNIME